MNMIDVCEWYHIADKDYNSACDNATLVRKRPEIVCYFSTQSVEKYLKGFLEYNEQKVGERYWIHDVNKLFDECTKFTSDFDTLIKDKVNFLNQYSRGDLRYIGGRGDSITDEESKMTLRYLLDIKTCKPLLDLREIIDNYKKINKIKLCQ